MAKIPVKSIWLRRAEGPHMDLGQSTVTSFEAADAVLKKWARTAPDDRSYNKVDFKVTWQDEETYDLVKKDEVRANLLGSHIQEFLLFHGGLWCPPHLTREDYEDYLERMERQKDTPKRMDYVRFLDKYEL